MPLFLDAKRYIRVPLEETYEGTWKACREEFKQRVIGGEYKRRAWFTTQETILAW